MDLSLFPGFIQNVIKSNQDQKQTHFTPHWVYLPDRISIVSRRGAPQSTLKLIRCLKYLYAAKI